MPTFYKFVSSWIRHFIEEFVILVEDEMLRFCRSGFQPRRESVAAGSRSYYASPQSLDKNWAELSFFSPPLNSPSRLSYDWVAHPEDRALLESNPSAEVGGMTEGQDHRVMPFFSPAPFDSPQSVKLRGDQWGRAPHYQIRLMLK
mgnify:CR=1 FL=1